MYHLHSSSILPMIYSLPLHLSTPQFLYISILADFFVNLPPLKILRELVDDILMTSVGLSGVLDLFDSLFCYWKNLVIPLFLDCVGRLVAIP